MDNPETRATLDTRHRNEDKENKNTTKKTKKINKRNVGLLPEVKLPLHMYTYIGLVWFGLWCLMPFSTIF